MEQPTPNSRKVRPDAILRQLPEERQQMVFAALQKKSYEEVRKDLAADGIKVGTTALADFYQFCSSEAFYRRAEVGRQQMQSRILEAHPEFTMDQATEMADAAFIATTAAVGDLEGYLGVRKIISMERKMGLEKRRVELLEKKAAQLEQVEKVMTDKLKPEEQARRIREILK